jgi:exportin-1
VHALRVLVGFTYLNDDDLFKLTLDFWADFVFKILSEERKATGAQTTIILLRTQPQQTTQRHMSPSPSQFLTPPQRLYKPVLTLVRRVLIDKMPKPEEVLVVEDENGDVVRESLKDVEVVALHKTTKDTLINLTNLDSKETVQIMLARLDQEMQQLNRTRLSTLCWAVGSISGAMREGGRG